jgi:hypothetical protein
VASQNLIEGGSDIGQNQARHDKDSLGDVEQQTLSQGMASND